MGFLDLMRWIYHYRISQYCFGHGTDRTAQRGACDGLVQLQFILIGHSCCSLVQAEGAHLVAGEFGKKSGGRRI